MQLLSRLRGLNNGPHLSNYHKESCTLLVV